jgi:outer membrane protein TolC
VIAGVIMSDFSVKYLVGFMIGGLVCLCGLAGCATKDYKKDADEQVYKIIDRKWQDDFGPRVNYKVSDTEPSTGDIRVPKAVPASGILTIPQAVAIATAYNREYQTQKEDLYIKALDLRLTRHQFEQQYFGIVTGGYTGDRNDTDLGMEANFGFNRLLKQGTIISTRIALAWADVLTGNLRSGWTSLLSAAITQPLLRGSDSKVVLENLTQAERDTLYQVRTFNRFRQTFVVSEISQYYGVLQLWDAMENARKNCDTLDLLIEQVETLSKAGRVPQLELERVRQDKLTAYDRYIQTQKLYQKALDEFKITLSLPTTTELQLDTNALETLRQSKMTMPVFSDTEAIETALLRRLDLVNVADFVTDAQRKVYVAADSLRAELNLVGSADVSSSKRADRQTLDWTRDDYSLGFELDLPLDRVPEQNVYRKALLTFNQRKRDYDQAADTVRLEVRNDYRNLTEAAQRYKVQTDALALAEKRYNNTLKLLQYGRASSRRVLDAQDDLIDAQDAATEALVNFTIASLNFYSDTGVLYVRPDGMWHR